MKIPNGFYFNFRLKNSLLALATGVLLGLLSLRVLPLPYLMQSPHHFFLYLILWAVAAVVIYQFAVQKYFTGQRRGEFEYAYLESLMQNKIKSILSRLPNRLEKDLSFIDPMTLYPRLRCEAEHEADPERRFYIYMSMGLRAYKDYLYSKALEAWGEAVRLKPHDLVANFRLAALWEYNGNGAKAIEGYQAALQDHDLDSPSLREFILFQIERVKAKGPRKGSVHPALSRIMW